MTTPDPLQCTFDDARRVNLRQGIALSTSAKVAFFAEMVRFAVRFGARDRLEGRRASHPSPPRPVTDGVTVDSRK